MSIHLRKQIGARPRWARAATTTRNESRYPGGARADRTERRPLTRRRGIGGRHALAIRERRTARGPLGAAPASGSQFLAPCRSLGGAGVSIRLHELRRQCPLRRRRFRRGKFCKQPIGPSGEEHCEATGRATRYHVIPTPSATAFCVAAAPGGIPFRFRNAPAETSGRTRALPRVFASRRSLPASTCSATASAGRLVRGDRYDAKTAVERVRRGRACGRSICQAPDPIFL